MDLLGSALADYYFQKHPGQLHSESVLGDVEEVPLAHFFRSRKEMPALETQAIAQCMGTVLDIGCGAGSHLLLLQENGLSCTGIDISPGAVQVARERGAKVVLEGDIRTSGVGKFDTLLLLMNGIGLAGSLADLPEFLALLRDMLQPGGQILMDSSDLQYLYERDEDGGLWVPGFMAYYGDMEYRWLYKGKQGEFFPWLFVDFGQLHSAASAVGLSCEMIAEGPHYDYLARLMPKK
ncbi:Methyltransferase domain-containing protein [Robiginitalea myxolifaciens]|uniref:Methyltransferase domain-containing protein n=1 Tax=Robiginitalea myxolifaciens TaxID=400055 RepID=A0A1I6HG18_9FLAO|nr:class I SAM-dependent methyltransferase [Robiginitalea myxolifaciens]SFR53432.1 Methyltransferase domain-containing protein [Robiginitalea myxolifaciens]